MAGNFDYPLFSHDLNQLIYAMYEIKKLNLPASNPYVAIIFLAQIFPYDDFCLIQGNDGSVFFPNARLL